MRNRIYYSFYLFSILSFSCTSIDRPDPKTIQIHRQNNFIENISFGISQEELAKLKGEPSKKAFDEKSQASIFCYIENKDGVVLPRENFVFNPDDGLTAKYMNVYEDEPESSLDFWKLKFPANDLTIKTNQIISKHSINYEKYIEINPKQTLVIKNNKVVKIYWEK
jgi:hypothetical protein